MRSAADADGMAIGAFAEGPAGAGYSGRVTSFVVLSCIVAGSGGILFGYDLGISGCLLLPSLLHCTACPSLPLFSSIPWLQAKQARVCQSLLCCSRGGR